MKLKQIRVDTRGTAIVEFAIALPVFTLMIFGIIWVGLVTWTQFGLQHSVGIAARCATVGNALSPSGVNTVCNNKSSVQSFAAAQYYGLGPATFVATLNTTCGSNPGNLVTGSYTFSLISLYFLKSSPKLTAQSCYPI
jgi:Flp pilus assembly protein TadG